MLLASKLNTNPSASNLSSTEDNRINLPTKIKNKNNIRDVLNTEKSVKYLHKPEKHPNLFQTVPLNDMSLIEEQTR